MKEKRSTHQDSRVCGQFVHVFCEKITRKWLRIGFWRGNNASRHSIATAEIKSNFRRIAVHNGYGDCFINQFNQCGGGVSVVNYGEGKNAKVVPNFSMFLRKSAFRDPYREERGFQLSQRALGNFNRLLSQSALFSGGFPKSPSEYRNCYGCDRAGKNSIVIPIASNIPKPSDRYVVGGAIIVSGVLVLFAYFVIKWSE